MKMLVVDDNKDNRKLLIKQFSSAGYNVSEAVNGKDALQKGLVDPPDILVTDILMPEMDGYQLCMEWKTDERLKNIPVVFYTATYTSDEDERFAHSLGADYFIRKPIDFQAFIQIISEVMVKIASGQYNRPDVTPPHYLNYLTEHNRILMEKLFRKVAELEKDITQRKEAEKALKESEEKYSSLIENGNDSIVIIEDGKIQYANPKLFEITGYAVSEVIGKPFYFFIAPEYRDLMKIRYQKRMAGEDTPFRYEFDIITKSGKCFSVEVNASLIKRENETIEMAIIRDISQRKQAEEALRESEERFRQFFENAQVYCYMVSPQGDITEMNSAACKALGYSREELVGQTMLKIYSPESQPDARRIFNQWNKTGLVENEELVILTKTGQKRNILISIGAIRDTSGKLISTVSVQRDITELKQSQEKAQQVETMTKLNQAKSQLLSEVAHEMRTPLQSIKGFIETLLEPDVKWSENDQKDFLTEAGKEADILMQLIRDLLDVSRIESGKMRLDRQYHKLEDILDSIKARLSILTSHHVLNIVLPSGLPNIFVDKSRIAQVITNLVENASKFSPPGSEITIAAKSEDNNIVISVKDHGAGMTRETIDKLFDRFYQAEQAATVKTRGTGLGLSICRGIVEAHDGKIRVESTVGNGTTFIFSIPGVASQK
jgi:PAS domain S-box-containing protein